MKQYLTLIFFILSIAVIIIGLRSDVVWSGIATWGLAFILLLCSAYFTKYISNEKKRSNKKH